MARWAAHSLPPPAWEKRCYEEKPACLLSEEMGRRKLTQFLKGQKSVAPPSPLQPDHLGKGKRCLAGCTVGVVALEKTCFLLNAFCQVRDSKYSKRTAASSWLRIAACRWLPHIWLLHPSTPQFYPCTTYLHFMQGNPKWHLSIIPTESRTPNTLSPK